jgi:hypothetical protein
MTRELLLLFLLGTLVGCGGGSKGSGIKLHADASRISGLVMKGTDVLKHGGGLYIIGSTTGGDRERENLTSVNSPGVLRSASGKTGPPYTFAVQRLNDRTWRVAITIGPMPTRLGSLSIPMDVNKASFDHYQFSSGPHDVGCGAGWVARTTAGGPIDSIPAACVIPGVGKVGAARTRGLLPWVELSGPAGKIRRTIVTSNAQRWHVYHHPYTDNSEAGWINVPAGFKVTHVEDVSVSP